MKACCKLFLARSWSYNSTSIFDHSDSGIYAIYKYHCHVSILARANIFCGSERQQFWNSRYDNVHQCYQSFTIYRIVKIEILLFTEFL